MLSDHWEDSTIHELDVINVELLLQGDIQCYLGHWGLLKIHKICRFTFNTAFVSSNNDLKFEKNERDPDNFKNNKKVADNFAIFLKFRSVCYCNSAMEFFERCVFCKRFIESSEWEKWENMEYSQQNMVISAIRSEEILFSAGQ